MQGRRSSLIGLLTIVFIATFGFTQVSLKIETVYDLAGGTLGDEDFSCSSSSYSNESDCEAVGECSHSVFTAFGQAKCEEDGTCSDISGTCTPDATALPPQTGPVLELVL